MAVMDISYHPFIKHSVINLTVFDNLQNEAKGNLTNKLLFLHVIFTLLLTFELLFFTAKSHPPLFSKDVAH